MKILEKVIINQIKHRYNIVDEQGFSVDDVPIVYLCWECYNLYISQFHGTRKFNSQVRVKHMRM